MAHHYYEKERASNLLAYRVFLEEFDISSFGDCLVAADVIEAGDGNLVLKAGRDFALGELVRIDLLPQRRTRIRNDGGFVVVGCVTKSDRISAGEVYRIEVTLLKLASEQYNTMLARLEAV
jgi:hypothetical protein